MMLQSACPSRSRIAEERIGSGALTATLSIFGNVVAGAGLASCRCPTFGYA
jgi:hypothetical protein